MSSARLTKYPNVDTPPPSGPGGHPTLTPSRARRPARPCPPPDGSVGTRVLVAGGSRADTHSGLAAVDDEWAGALVDYRVYRAPGADGVDAMNARAAAEHLAAFERRAGP